MCVSDDKWQYFLKVGEKEREKRVGIEILKNPQISSFRDTHY